MRKFYKAVLLSTVAVILIATPILAFLYQAPFTIIEDAGTDYDMFPASVLANNTFMAANGFMEADALDTRVETLAGSDKPHMVADDRTLGAVPVEANSQTNLFFTTGDTDLASMDILTGFDGFVTIPDAAALEPGDDFEFEFTDTWIDTSAGAGKNLVSKTDAFSITISAEGSITASITGESDTFTPDADPEVDSVDGQVERFIGAGEDWGVIQGAAVGTNKSDSGVTIDAIFSADSNLNKFDILTRGFLLFDTSPLPNGATILSAELRVFGTVKTDQRPWGDLTLNIFSSSPATDTNLIIQDYDQVGVVPFAGAITFAAFDPAGWNTFTLNANGIAAIDDTGVSMFSMREATYDAPDIEPAWTASKFGKFGIQSSEGANPPELIVTLAPLTVTAINQTTGEHDVSVTADTVDFEISVDGAVAGDGFDSVALAGVSVPDTAADWILLDSSTNLVTPYSGAYQQTVSSVLRAWYAPITIVENTGEAGTADAGTQTTLDDAILTQPNDFWIGAKLIIVTTTDTNAPQGETSVVTGFDAGNDRLTFDTLTAVVDAGDTYTIDYGTLVSRSSIFGIDFDGTDDQVLVTDAATIQNVFDAGGTLSLWANVTSDGENNAGRLADKTSWYLATDNEAGGETKLTFFYDFDGAADGLWVTDDTVTTIGSWDNIVVVYDNAAVANNPTIYVNDVALTVGSGLTESTTPVGTRVTDAAINLIIGDNVAGNRAYDGIEDEVWLFSRSITADEVTANFNDGVGVSIPVSSTNLELELHMEDGSGATASDSSGNSNDGALTNALWVAGHVPQTARITWGVNPTGISVTLGSMVAASQPVIGGTEAAPARDILPPITVSDWFGDGTVSGSTLTNPIRPLITAMSDNTTLTEIQVWRLMGVIAILFATVATAFTIRQHQGITAIVAGVMLGGLVAFDSNIFPMWTLVIATGLFIAGVVAERSPSL